MLAIGNHVMIIGGVTPAGTTNSVLVYDSQNRFSLKRGPSMMKARAFFACSTMVSPAHGGRTVAVVAGGYGSPDTTEILDYTKPGSSWQLSEYFQFFLILNYLDIDMLNIKSLALIAKRLLLIYLSVGY